jgi:hypothetical protein
MSVGRTRYLSPGKQRCMGTSKKAKLTKLSRAEARLYARLRVWLGSDNVVSFLARLVRTYQDKDGRRIVPSASKRGHAHVVDIGRGVCTCTGYYWRRRCSHLKLARIKEKIERANYSFRIHNRAILKGMHGE